MGKSIWFERILKIFGFIFKFFGFVFTVGALYFAMKANNIATSTYSDSVRRDSINQITSNQMNKTQVEIIDSIKKEISSQLLVNQNQLILIKGLINLNVIQSRPIIGIGETWIENEAKHNYDTNLCGFLMTAIIYNYGERPTKATFMNFVIVPFDSLEKGYEYSSSLSVNKTLLPGGKIPVRLPVYDIQTRYKDNFYYCIKIIYDDPLLRRKYSIYSIIHMYIHEGSMAPELIMDSDEAKSVASIVTQIIKQNNPIYGDFKDIEEEYVKY